MHELVKTITLDDDAYRRLKAWKRKPGESFSSVVKRVLPEPGTLGAFLGFVESNATYLSSGNELLERTVEQRSLTKEDPWI